MRRRLALLVLLTTALLTTACGGSGGGATTAPATTSAAAVTPTATPTPTPTPTPVATPAALVVSVSAITVVDAGGAALQTASFSDGAGVVALLTSAIGSTPAGQANAQYATTSYDWGAFTLIVSDGGAARINIGATAVGSLQLRADGGIAVGTAVEAALSQGAVAGTADPSMLRLEVTDAPGTTSLENPGQTGVDFVGLVTDGTAVTRILSPADDYSDL